MINGQWPVISSDLRPSKNTFSRQNELTPAVGLELHYVLDEYCLQNLNDCSFTLRGLRRDVKTYQQLIVWQKAMDLVEEVYKVSHIFPKEETYGLTSQLRRAAV